MTHQGGKALNSSASAADLSDTDPSSNESLSFENDADVELFFAAMQQAEHEKKHDALEHKGKKTKGGCKRKSDRIKKNEELLKTAVGEQRTAIEKQLALDRYMRAGDGARKKDRKQAQRLHIKGFAKALPVKAPPPPPPFKASSPPAPPFKAAFKAMPISANAVTLLPMSSMDMMDDAAAPYCGHDEG
jgi:hypothetical protein